MCKLFQSQHVILSICNAFVWLFNVDLSSVLHKTPSGIMRVKDEYRQQTSRNTLYFKNLCTVYLHCMSLALTCKRARSIIYFAFKDLNSYYPLFFLEPHIVRGNAKRMLLKRLTTTLYDEGYVVKLVHMIIDKYTEKRIFFWNFRAISYPDDTLDLCIIIQMQDESAEEVVIKVWDKIYFPYNLFLFEVDDKTWDLHAHLRAMRIAALVDAIYRYNPSAMQEAYKKLVDNIIK